MSTSSTCTQPKSVITDEELQFFNENGYLILRNVLSSEEQKRLQDASHTLMVNGNPEQPGPGLRISTRKANRKEHAKTD